MLEYKRKEIVANQRDRLRSQERKEILFYSHSHFTPTRGGLERCFVCFMARSLHIYQSKCVWDRRFFRERSCRDLPEIAVPRIVLLRLSHCPRRPYSWLKPIIALSIAFQWLLLFAKTRCALLHSVIKL